MKADPLTPVQLFDGAKRYLIPLFQRPYVWTEKDQWAPLWDDVRAIADKIIMAGPFATVTPHFMGAIVTEPITQLGALYSQWTVIDGQQRLTTMQLLLDAAEDITRELGDSKDADALRRLVVNADTDEDDEGRFKVWPTNRDRAGFSAAMDDVRPVPRSEAGSLLVLAHAFFSQAIREWATAGEASPEILNARLRALRITLTQTLSVVGITLDPGDNAQVIFETLNFRGKPLLAADLIKNLLFQIAQAQGQDVEKLYESYWSEFDDDYWRTSVRQGRLMRPRIDVFLQHWLTMTLGEEVASDQVFARFRERIVSPQEPVKPVFAKLHHDLLAYRNFLTAPAGTVVERFRYHVVEVLGITAVMPLALWFLVRDESSSDAAESDKALATLDSWLLRRAILRLTNKDLNHLAIDMVSRLNEPDRIASPAQVLTQYLLDQTAPSRLWPDDESVRNELETLRAYAVLRRDLTRALLEACEDSLRAEHKVEAAHCPRNLSIEHVMPQSWQSNWPLGNLDDDAAQRRDALIHTMGNLTLVTGAHNSALSNRPWQLDGGKDKRDYLNSNSVLLMNARLVQQHPHQWTDTDIVCRGRELADRIIDAWPRPGGGVPTATALTTTKPAREAKSSGQVWTYEVHGPGWSVTNLAQRRAHLVMVQQLHAAGVSMQQITDVVDSARIRQLPGTLSGQELWEAFTAQFGIADDGQRRWYVDEAVHDGGMTYVVRKSWGRRGDDLLTRLSGLCEGVGWSAVTSADHRGNWEIDDVLDALADEPALTTAFLALVDTVESLGGRAYGSSAALPSAGLSLPLDNGTIWLYSFYTDNLAQPLRVGFRSVAAPAGADEAFARRIAEAVPEFPLDELLASDFHRAPTISAQRLVQPGVPEALGEAASVYLAGATQPRWWAVHNDTLPFSRLHEGSFISIGWDEIPDATTLGSSLDNLRRLLRAAHPDAHDNAISNWVGIITKFSRGMRRGDYIVAPDKTERTLNIGEVSGDYWYEQDAEKHRHRVPVTWLRTGISREQFSQPALNEIGSALTLFRVRRNVDEFAAYLLSRL